MTERNEPIDSITEEEAFRLLRGKGKPWAFVIIAVQIASSADQMGDFISWLIGRSTPMRPLPPRRHWMNGWR